MVYMLTFGVHWWQMLPYIAYMDPMGMYVCTCMCLYTLALPFPLCAEFFTTRNGFCAWRGPRQGSSSRRWSNQERYLVDFHRVMVVSKKKSGCWWFQPSWKNMSSSMGLGWHPFSMKWKIIQSCLKPPTSCKCLVVHKKHAAGYCYCMLFSIQSKKN